MWLCGTASCDLVIAASMVYYLKKSKSGFRSTTIMLEKVIRITVETGLACAAGALIDMGLFIGFPNTNYHLTMCLLLSKLYSNSLMVVSKPSFVRKHFLRFVPHQVLNSRVRIVGGRDESTVQLDPTLSTIQWIHSASTRTDSRIPGAAVRLLRFNDDDISSHITGETTDVESMKILKVCSFSVVVGFLLAD